jgi:hypothetical protein
MWLPGETFTDSANGIKVRVTGATTSGYDVTINPSDAGGIDSVGTDPDAPQVQSSTPSPEKRRVALRPTITAIFDEVMDKNTLTAANVELYKSGASTPVGATVTPALDGTSVTLKPTTRLKAGRWYYVALWKDSTGITDLTGDPLSGGGDYLVDDDDNFVYWWFKTRS